MSYTPMEVAMGKIRQFYRKYQNGHRTERYTDRRIQDIEKGRYFEER